MPEIDAEVIGDSGDETKQCPYCAETIKAAAIKCRYCGSELPSHEPSIAESETPRRAGYCRACGHNVWLAQSGGCINGHSEQDVTATWMARKLVQSNTAKTSGTARRPDSVAQVVGIAGIVLGLAAMVMPYFAAVFLVPAAFICGIIAWARGQKGLGVAALVMATIGLMGVLAVSQQISNIMKDPLAPTALP